VRQLQLDFDQNTERPIPDLPVLDFVVEQNGQSVMMFYRRYTDIPTMSTGNWWYRPEHWEDWRPVKSPHIRKMLDTGRHPRFEYLHADTDLTRIEAFIMDNDQYDLEYVEKRLRDHPYMHADMWKFLLWQRGLYREEKIIGTKHFEAWCEPNWDKTEHALYKATTERRHEIIRYAYDVLEQVRPCPSELVKDNE
jgi:hypothetical protein